MRKLDFSKYFILEDDKKYFFRDENNNLLDSSETIKLFNEVISMYKVPTYLSKVQIYYYNDIDSYHNNLIYVGYDRNNYLQYIYGKGYIRKRNLDRLEKVKRFVKNKDLYNKRILDFIKLQKKDYILYQFGILLLLETNFYMRLGKSEYASTGLLSLRKKNIKISKSKISIKFLGKKNIEQYFEISNKNVLYKHIKFIYEENNSEKLFTLTDSKFYELMNIYFDKISIKDFRTYGVNHIFLEQLCIMESVSKAIESTANIIGHSKAICKSSYICTQIYEYLKSLDKDNLLNLIIDMKNRKDKLSFIIDKL